MDTKLSEELRIASVMRFNREFAIINSETHTIPPIRKLLSRYIKNPNQWLDPFARNCLFATYTNDINPEMSANYNLDFREFLNLDVWKSFNLDGIILDPPFNTTRAKRTYDLLDKHFTFEDTQGSYYTKAWDIIVKLKPRYVIQMGWHTNGKKQYYKLIELLVVHHGGAHNDTLVSVHERKNSSVEDFL